MTTRSPGGWLLKVLIEPTAVLLSDRIGDGDSALVVPEVIDVSMLHCSEPLSIAARQLSEPIIHVDIGYVACAVASGGHREQERGAQQIRHLDASVVLAVAEDRHLQDA